MKTKDLEIRDYFYYPEVDSFLIRADRPGCDKRLPRSVVGWMPRNRPSSLICVRSFPDMAAAVTLYKTTLESVIFPPKILEIKDRQKQKVYDWEDHVLMPVYDTPLTNYADANTMLMRVCREMNIPLPKLLWMQGEKNSKYVGKLNTIILAHRTLIPLLHEIAHAMQDKKPHNKSNNIHHSPAFVWDAITLYNRYAGIDLHFLVQSAVAADILGTCKIETPHHYTRKISPQAPGPS